MSADAYEGPENFHPGAQDDTRVSRGTYVLPDGRLRTETDAEFRLRILPILKRWNTSSR